METLGDLLREARECKGATLADVEAFTKIRKKHLQALEEGEYARLPPQVYVRGFLRGLAAYLELDADSVLARYSEETAGQEAAPPPVRLTSEPLMPAPLRIVNWLAGAGILAVIALLAYWIYQQRLWEQVLPLIVPAPTATVTLSTTTPTQQAAFSLRPTHTEIPADTATSTATIPQATMSLPTATHLPTIPPSTSSPSPTDSLSTPSPPPTPTASMTHAPTRVPEPTATALRPTFTATRSASLTEFPQLLLIRLEITERAWVRVVIDQEAVFEGILEEGAFRTWVAKREALIHTGNAGGTWLRINDGPRERMGEPGQVVKTTFLLQETGIVVTATPSSFPAATSTPKPTG